MTTLLVGPLLEEAEARNLLGELEGVFVEGHLHAWRQWQRLQDVCQRSDAADLLVPLTATTRANFLNNHCVTNVVNALERRQGPTKARPLDLDGINCVLVTDNTRAAVVRFKHLGPDLLPRNVATEQQRRLDRQEWPVDLFDGLDLPDITPPTWLVCGYRLTADELNVGSVHLVCAQNRNVEWECVLHGGDGIAAVVNIPLPGSPRRTSRVTSTKRKPAKPTASGQGGDDS